MHVTQTQTADRQSTGAEGSGSSLLVFHVYSHAPLYRRQGTQEVETNLKFTKRRRSNIKLVPFEREVVGGGSV